MSVRRDAKLVEIDRLDPRGANRTLEALHPAAFDHRVPDRERAGRETPVRLRERLDDLRVLVLHLVRRIDQHQSAALRRRHQADAAFKPVRAQHGDAAIRAELLLQRPVLCGVELEEIDAVRRSQQLAREPRRAGIAFDLRRSAVVAADELDQPHDRGGRARSAVDLAIPARNSWFFRAAGERRS